MDARPDDSARRDVTQTASDGTASAPPVDRRASDADDARGGAPLQRIPRQSGAAFVLRRGDVLRVVDPCGEQVADLYAFAREDLACALSSGRSLDYASKLYLSTGDRLYASDSSVLFTIVADTVGRHDFTLTPCSQEMFERLYGVTEHHPSCFENLCTALAPYGVAPERIGTTFNIFMNVAIDPDGRLEVRCPRSRAGDHVELRAERDLLCGLTACSAEGSNNGTLKPIDFSIRRAAGGG